LSEDWGPDPLPPSALNSALVSDIISPLAKRGRGGLMFRRMFYFFYKYLSDFCQTKYLNIYRTDLHEICRTGRTLAVGKRFETTLQSPNGHCYIFKVLWGC